MNIYIFFKCCTVITSLLIYFHNINTFNHSSYSFLSHHIVISVFTAVTTLINAFSGRAPPSLLPHTADISGTQNSAKRQPAHMLLIHLYV